MGDGAAERRLSRLDGINVDELIVAGCFGEQVDAFLIDGQPFGASQLLANVTLELCNR